MPKNIIGVYMITNTVNGKRYIGSSSNTPYRRATHFSRLRLGTHFNPHMQSAFNMYGEAAFVFSILENVADIETLVEREQYWMDTLRPEYNLRPQAISNRGVKYPPRSAEHRAKISALKLGSKRTPEQRQRMSEANKGRKVSIETRLKHAKVWAGKNHTAESRAKMSVSMGTPVLQLDKNTGAVIAIHHSINEAARYLDGHFSAIARVVRGEQKTAYGYRWRKADDSKEM